ncbi:MAG: DinB family protein [Blastocatellia bacterium]|nr:DinB family protein [Blastocatellia bacterium]
MTYNTMDDILAANEASHTRFHAATASLSEAQLQFRPEAGRWTIGEIAEHVAIVNDGFLRITHKLLRQAEAAGKPARAVLDLGPILPPSAGEQNSPKFSAPERVHPTGTLTLADAFAKMRETLDGFAAIQSRIEATDLSEETFPHPAFGPFNAYQWMILLGEHQDRHRLQIEDVKAAAGFPA